MKSLADTEGWQGGSDSCPESLLPLPPHSPDHDPKGPPVTTKLATLAASSI